ncbi:MAG TPA: hypothetical protein VE963_18065 [Reyranella sp.]|nr:hypothetical protein [Reyranella sp.]
MNRTAFSTMVAPNGQRRKTTRGLPKYDLGGIFGGGMQTTGQSYGQSGQTTSTTIDPGGQYYPVMSKVLGIAGGLADRPYQPYDVSQRFAGFTPDQLAAQQKIRDVQGAWQPFYNQAGAAFNQAQTQAGGVGTAGQGAFNQAAAGPGGLGAANPWLNRAGASWTDPGTAQAWMNPFQQNVMDTTANTALRNFMGPGGAWQGITDAFTGGAAGQFGRQRMGDVAGQTLMNFGQGLGNALGQIGMQGYNQGQTAFNTEQQRLAGMGATAGQLGIGDVTSRTGLGAAQTTAAAQGAQSLIGAGTAQQGLGTATQGAQYKDIGALAASGQQQQQLEQQQRDFEYQQNREAFNWPYTAAQQAQSLAGNWTLPTQTSSQSWTQSGTMGPTGSIAGNVLGAGLSIAGLSTGKNSTVGGDIANYVGGLFGSGNPTINSPSSGGFDPSAMPGVGLSTGQRGGRVPEDLRTAFGPGGYVPTVSAMRKRVQARMPAMMGRIQQLQGGPGVMPGQTPGMMPPMAGGPPGGPPGPPGRAFAEGGPVDDDEAADLELVRRGVHAHERALHPGHRLTAFAEGGDTDRGYFDTQGGTLGPPVAALQKAPPPNLTSDDLYNLWQDDPRTAFGLPHERVSEGTSDPRLGRTAANVLSTLVPGGGMLAHTDWAQRRLSNPDFYRTVAAGAVPFSDEIEAGLRSAFGSGKYDDYLREAREGRARYGRDMGDLEAGLTEGAGTAGSLLLGGGLSAGAKALGLVGPRLAALAARYPKLARMIPLGTAGAVRGYGEGEGEEDRVQRALQSGVTGGLFGLGTHYGGKAAQWAWPRVKSAFGYGPGIARDPRFLEPHELPDMTAFGG